MMLKDLKVALDALTQDTQTHLVMEFDLHVFKEGPAHMHV